MKSEIEMSHEQNEEKTKKTTLKTTTHLVDIVLWVLWAILMWGFLITLSLIDSPSNSPGVHELIITSYFLGFAIIFAAIYIIVVKRG